MAGEITKKANAFIASHYDRLHLAIPKGLKAEMNSYVKSHPDKYRSVTALVCQAVQELMQKDRTQE